MDKLLSEEEGAGGFEVANERPTSFRRKALHLLI